MHASVLCVSRCKASPWLRSAVLIISRLTFGLCPQSSLTEDAFINTRVLFPPPFCPHLHPPSTKHFGAGALPTFVNHLHDMLHGETLPITNICGPCSFCCPFLAARGVPCRSQCVLHSREGSAGACDICHKFLSGRRSLCPPLWHMQPQSGLPSGCSMHRAARDTCNAKHGSAHRLGWDTK